MKVTASLRLEDSLKRKSPGRDPRQTAEYLRNAADEIEALLQDMESKGVRSVTIHNVSLMTSVWMEGEL